MSFADEETADGNYYGNDDMGDAGFSMDGEEEDEDDLTLPEDGESDDVFSFDLSGDEDI